MKKFFFFFITLMSEVAIQAELAAVTLQDLDGKSINTS